MKIIIPGKPLAQKRHRFRRYGNKIFTYDPSADDKKNIKEYIMYKYKKKIRILKPPILFELMAYMPIPISYSNKQKLQLIGEYHVKKIDIDNCSKLYMDSLEGLLYTNDSQIAEIHCIKKYDTNPRVEINLSTIK